jgi:predicted dehydrogenase
VTLRVGVVGLGVGEAHARAFAAHPECELRLVHDLDAERAERVASALGAEVAASYEELLEAVDVVSIASFDDAHFEQALLALRAHLHVFVEKPLCRTAHEVRALREAAGDRQLASNLVLRAAPLYRRLRDDVRTGALGALYAFDGDYLYGRFHKITEGWRGSVDEYSVMLGGGVHLVDLLLWVTGERPESVTAVGNRIATERTGFRYDDYVAATFSFESGLVARITANFASVHPHQHVVRVFGTEGTFVYDDAGARLHASREGRAEPLALEAEPEDKGALIPSFVDAIIRKESAELPGPDHEFAVISACIAADKALTTGGTVDVEYA